jgi:hypothetical protein
MYGVLNKPIGGDYLAGLQALMAKQGAQDEAARKQLETNKRMDLFKAMIAAGEATRGQRGGLGALAAGFGKSMIPALEARAQEAAAIEAAPIKREGLLIKAKYDIQELQRAQGNNDLKTVNAQKAKLFDTATKLYASGNAALAREIAAIAGIREAEIRAAATEQAARTRAAARGQGTPKTTDLRDQYQIELDALLAQGLPNDAFTRKRAMNIAQDRISKSAGTFRAEITAREKADEWIQSQLFGPKGMQYRKLQRENPAEYKKVMEELELESERRYGVRGSAANIPSTAPTAAPKPAPSSSAPTPPPGFVPVPTR